MNIVAEIKNYVETECKKPTSRYGYEPFTNHFVPMVKYAGKLAGELGADKEVVLLAAWLHDIGSIRYGREDHHITGEKIAEKILSKYNYPRKKINLIKKCIINHRSSQNRQRLTIEEKIIADADAISNFDNIEGLFKAALVYEGRSQKEARISVREKLQRKWKQLHFDDSREIIRSKYTAMRILLK